MLHTDHMPSSLANIRNTKAFRRNPLAASIKDFFLEELELKEIILSSTHSEFVNKHPIHNFCVEPVDKIIFQTKENFVMIGGCKVNVECCTLTEQLWRGHRQFGGCKQFH